MAMAAAGCQSSAGTAVWTGESLPMPDTIGTQGSVEDFSGTASYPAHKQAPPPREDVDKARREQAAERATGP